MAKKAKKKNKRALANELPENVLPQNILPMGERVEENKNIYIAQTVYKEIHKFTRNKTTNESGGILVGTVIEEFGKTNMMISGFVEAKFCEATPTTLKFTHETWEYVHKEIDKKHAGKKIVGWIHTHPDFGIFLSEYDKFIHQNFFSEAHQIAYVVDPIQNIEGFYFWINGNIEKCKGFYVYDKIGTPITVESGNDQSEEKRTQPSLFSIKNILIALLTVSVSLLIFANISVSNQLAQLKSQQKTLESQQVTLTDSANLTLSQMQQILMDQDARIQELETALRNAGLIEEPEDDPSEQPGTGETVATADEATRSETTEGGSADE